MQSQNFVGVAGLCPFTPGPSNRRGYQPRPSRGVPHRRLILLWILSDMASKILWGDIAVGDIKERRNKIKGDTSKYSPR